MLTSTRIIKKISHLPRVMPSRLPSRAVKLRSSLPKVNNASPKKFHVSTKTKIALGIATTLPPLMFALLKKDTEKFQEVEEAKNTDKIYPMLSVPGRKITKTDQAELLGLLFLMSLPLIPIPLKILFFILEAFLLIVSTPIIKTLTTDFQPFSQSAFIEKIMQKFPEKQITRGMCNVLSYAYVILKDEGIDLIKELKMIEANLDSGLALTRKQIKILDLLVYHHNTYMNFKEEETKTHGSKAFEEKIVTSINKAKEDHTSGIYFNNDKWLTALDTASNILDSMQQNGYSKTVIGLYSDPTKKDLKTQIARFLYGNSGHVIGLFRKDQKIGLFDSNFYAGEFNEADVAAAKESLARIIYFYNHKFFLHFSLVQGEVCSNVKIFDERHKKTTLAKVINGDPSSKITLEVSQTLLPGPSKKRS
ncbi:MAG: hypothetical protein ACYCQI_06990 [Gammaproteobacteria bacterium]